MPLFLIENMSKGYINNLHSCVGYKHKWTVYVTVETCMRTLANCAVSPAGTPGTVFAPPFRPGFLWSQVHFDFIAPSTRQQMRQWHTDTAKVHLLSFRRGKNVIDAGAKWAMTPASAAHHLCSGCKRKAIWVRNICSFVLKIILHLLFLRVFLYSYFAFGVYTIYGFVSKIFFLICTTVFLIVFLFLSGFYYFVSWIFENLWFCP